MTTIDCNADVGEGYDDLPIFPYVTSVSIACGEHAGDRSTMARCVAEAARLGVAVGAHPGYPDREGGGRRALAIPPDELRASLSRQIRSLIEVAAEHGAGLTHVKPHGALYNSAASDEAVAAVVARAVADVDPALRIVGFAGSALLSEAAAAGLDAVPEGFVDRRYRSVTSLVPRDLSHALILDPAEASRQALALATGMPIDLEHGRARVEVRTLCLHADTPGALAIARAVREALESNGVQVAALHAG